MNPTNSHKPGTATAPSRGRTAPAEDPATPPSEHVEVVTGAEADYRSNLAEASARKTDPLVRLHAPSSVILQNVAIGVAAVLALRGTLGSVERDIDWSLVLDTPSVANGYVFASVIANRQRDSRATVDTTALGVLRKKLLFDARNLANDTVFDSVTVRTLGRRTGAGPMCHAVVDLVNLYNVHATEIGGRTVITSADLARAMRLATELLGRLRPRSVPLGPRSNADAAAKTIRDQFATLLAERWLLIERIAGWAWGRAIGEHVPPLRAMSHRRRRAARPVAQPASNPPLHPA